MLDDTTTIGDAMLDLFRAYGVEYIFSSPGSEWAPIWDALARSKTEGRGPGFINVRHEDLAVTLAIGYYRQAVKLPVVLLHTGVGTLHAAMALRTARFQRVPMVVLAGDSAGYGEMPGIDPGVWWSRDLSDTSGSAGMAQPYVKRSSAVTSPQTLFGMLQDACRIALTPPFGPVFLSVPQEFMAGASTSSHIRCTPPPSITYADSAALEHVAAHLVQAERPVILTEYAGRDPRNVELLVKLAESLALPVIETSYAEYLNFPRDHALHQGFEGGELLRDADLVLLVNNRAPWHPASNGPKKAKVFLIDDDPSNDLPHYWGYGVDQIIGGDLPQSLQRLTTSIEKMIEERRGTPAKYQERRTYWQKRHDQQREEWRVEALSAAQTPLDGRQALLTIGENLPQDAIVTEETITHRRLVMRYLKRNLGGTWHTTATGGLGVGVGIAMGLKVAAPDRLVVAFEGDGSFNYNPILAAFGFAQQYKMPILVIVMNNQNYAAMKAAHLRSYPDGWATRTGTFLGSEIKPAPDYVRMVEAFGGYGERVDDPEMLSAALQRAIERVKDGQLALLDLMVNR